MMASRFVRQLPRTKPFAGRFMATAAPTPTPLGAPVKPPRQPKVWTAASLRKPPKKNAETKEQPKAEPEPNYFKELWEAHKHNKLAIAVVIICAVSADAAVSYNVFFRGRKEGELINKGTVYDKMAEKLAPHLINEEGLSPMER